MTEQDSCHYDVATKRCSGCGWKKRTGRSCRGFTPHQCGEPLVDGKCPYHGTLGLLDAPPRKFIIGQDRNEQNAVRAHYYEQMPGDSYELVPMCEYGWNRSDGTAFSIFRGWGSTRGVCKVCKWRIRMNLPAITKPKGHPTKWV